MLSGTRGEKKGGYGLSVMRCATGHKVVAVTLDMQGAQEWRPHFLLRLELSKKRAEHRDEEEGKRLCMCMCLHKQKNDKTPSLWNLSFIPRVCLFLSSLHCDASVSAGETQMLCSRSIFSFLLSHPFVLYILGTLIWTLCTLSNVHSKLW